MLEGTHFEEFESEPCPVGWGLVINMKNILKLQGVPFEKVGFNPLSWRLFMAF